MKLYVDDIRPAPFGWELARTVAEAKRMLETGDVQIVSLDHDMGACHECEVSGESVGNQLSEQTSYFNWCPHAEDGTALVEWMIANERIPPVVMIHSMNPVGRRRMELALAAHARRKDTAS